MRGRRVAPRGGYVQRKGFSLLPLLAVGLVWMVSGCQPEPSGASVGSARFESHVDPTMVSTGVVRVSVSLEIPSAGFSRTLDLDNAGGEWTGTMEGIPAGDNRSFTAEAFGADGTKLFAGSASGVTITAGQTARVSLLLEQLAPPPAANSAPVLGPLELWPTRVKPGESATLELMASDADGDPLTYRWSASGCTGTWVDSSPGRARFTPDAVPATGACACRLSVTVEDGRGGQGQGSMFLCVATPSESLPPVIVSLSFRQPEAGPVGPLSLGVEAEDPQGSALDFSWTANTGTLGSPVDTASTSSVSWTPPTCLTSGNAIVTVTVRNALGLSTSHAFTIPGLPDCSPPHNSWSAVGALSFGRTAHTATELP